jgi:hypothetical protein
MVKSDVHLAEGGFDLAGGAGGAARLLIGRDASQRAEQAGAELHEQDAELQASRREMVASAGAEALDELVRSQFTQVVAQLAQAVVRLGQPMASQYPGMHLAGGPVGDEGAGVQQRFEQADHPIIFQLQARDAARANDDGTSKARQRPAVHRASR